MAGLVIVNIRKLLRYTLRKADRRVTLASNGQEVVTHVGRSRPHLILLDVMMPVTDGFAVLRHHLQQLNQMPAIILTALDQDTQVARRCERLRHQTVLPRKLITRINIQIRVQELEREVRRCEAYHRGIFQTASALDLLLDTEDVIVQANNAASVQRGRSVPKTSFQRPNRRRRIAKVSGRLQRRGRRQRDPDLRNALAGPQTGRSSHSTSTWGPSI